jgi:hypothetical protein
MSVPATIERTAAERRIRAERHGSARQALLPIKHGCETYCLTHGQFDLIDALRVLLGVCGPASMTVATWTAAAADIRAAERLLRDRAILSLRFLVDRSFEARQPEFSALVRELFGDDAVAVSRVHAKFAVICNSEWNLVVRTSMNLNANPRLETIEVSDDRALAEFLEREVDGFFGCPRPVAERARDGLDLPGVIDLGL